jgi:hypothetical protein
MSRILSNSVPKYTKLTPSKAVPRPGFESRLGHVGFVVDKVAMGQVFSEYFCSPANSHSTDCSKFIIIIRGWYNRPIIGHSTKLTQSHPKPRY